MHVITLDTMLAMLEHQKDNSGGIGLARKIIKILEENDLKLHRTVTQEQITNCTYRGCISFDGIDFSKHDKKFQDEIDKLNEQLENLQDIISNLRARCSENAIKEIGNGNYCAIRIRTIEEEKERRDNNYLFCDDLVALIKEAVSKEKLEEILKSKPLENKGKVAIASMTANINEWNEIKGIKMDSKENNNVNKYYKLFENVDKELNLTKKDLMWFLSELTADLIEQGIVYTVNNDNNCKIKYGGLITDKDIEPIIKDLISKIKPEHDTICHPSHYCDGRKYEPKDVIRDWGLNFNIGSAVKYLSRAGRKGDAIEDLEKAKQFIQFEIDALKEENENV